MNNYCPHCGDGLTAATKTTNPSKVFQNAMAAANTAILHAREVYRDDDFLKWTSDWLAGKGQDTRSSDQQRSFAQIDKKVRDEADESPDLDAAHTAFSVTFRVSQMIDKLAQTPSAIDHAPLDYLAKEVKETSGAVVRKAKAANSSLNTAALKKRGQTLAMTQSKKHEAGLPVGTKRKWKAGTFQKTKTGWKKVN